MFFMIIKFVATSLVITLAIALVLVATNRPRTLAPDGGLDFSNTLNTQVNPLPVLHLLLPDGWQLPYRRVDGPADAPLLIMVHGSGWYGAQFDALAPQLARHATVLAPDLRGHGPTPGRRGDIDYIGQFEDDLAALIKAMAKPGQQVVLAGHSSGGGLVVRFAGGPQGGLINGAILLAPFLKYNAPTTRQNSGNWAYTLTARLIGLSMLNAFKIKALNHLTVIQFAMPKQVLDGPLGANATTAYSYRLNTAYAPRNAYEKDISALPAFLLLAGAKDEAFIADAYQPLMSGLTDKGQYHLIDGASHLDVVNTPETLDLMGKFLDQR